MVPYGTLWYHRVPYVLYGTRWYHRVHYGTIRYPMVPYSAIWYLITVGYHMVPYGTIWYPVLHGTTGFDMVPTGTIWYHRVPYGTIGYHGQPCVLNLCVVVTLGNTKIHVFLQRKQNRHGHIFPNMIPPMSEKFFAVLV